MRMVPCYYCGVSFPEDHTVRHTARSGMYYGEQVVDACFVCIRHIDPKGASRRIREKQSQIEYRDRIVRRMTQKKRQPQSAVEWQPGLEPPR